MANYGYMAKIGSDTSGLQAGLKAADSALKSTDRELKQINNSIKQAESEGASTATQQAQKQEVLTKAIVDTTEKLRQLKSVEEQMKAARDNGKISSEQYRQYEREVANTESRLRSYERELRNVESSSRSAETASEGMKNALREVNDGAQKAAGSMREIAETAAKVGSAIAAAGVSAAKFAVDVGGGFESSMSKVKAYSGASGEEFNALAKKAKEMGAQTSKSASESADALGYMALAGWNTEQMLTGLEPILRASEAGGADLARTSDLVTDSMSAMGVAVEDLEHYLNVCTQAQSNSNTSLTQMLEAYVGVGGSLRNLNVPIEESATLLGILANRGLKGAEAGTKLSSILVNLVGANKSAAAAMDELGVSAWDSEGNFIGLKNTLLLLDDALAGCTEQQRQFFEAKIGGKTQIDTLQALIAGVKLEYDGLHESLVNCDGALMSTAKTMQDNLQGSLTVMKSELEAVGISVYSYLEEPMKKAVQEINKELVILNGSISEGQLGDSLKKLSSATGELTEQFAEFAVSDGIPALIDALQWIADNIDVIISGVKTLGVAWATWKLATLAEGIGQMIIGLKNYTAAAKAAEGEQLALNAALKANEFAAIVTVIVAAAYALGEYITACGNAKLATAQITSDFSDAAKGAAVLHGELVKVNEAYEEEAKKLEDHSKKANDDWEKLRSLADEQGNVNDNMETAQGIVNELNTLLGTQITIIDGQIQGYSDLCSSMDEYIKTSERAAKMEYLKPQYSEAVYEIENAKKEFDKATTEYGDKSRKYEINKQSYEQAKSKYAFGTDEYESWRIAFKAANPDMRDDETVEQYIARLEAEKNDLNEAMTNKRGILRGYEKIISEYNDLSTEELNKQHEKNLEADRKNFGANSSMAASAKEKAEADAKRQDANSAEYQTKLEEREKNLKAEIEALEKRKKQERLQDKEYYKELEKIIENSADKSSDTYINAYDKLWTYKEKKDLEAANGIKSGKTKSPFQTELDEVERRLSTGEYKGKIEQYYKDLADIRDRYAGTGSEGWQALDDKVEKYQSESDKAVAENRLKTASEALKKFHDMGLMSDTLYYDSLRRLLENYSDESSKIYKELNSEIQTYDKETAENKKKSFEEQKKEYKEWADSIKTASKKIADKEKELEKTRENIANGITSGKALYDTVTGPDGKERNIYNSRSMDKRTQDIQKYMEDYQKLLKTNIPKDLLDEIEGMSFDERKQTVKELLKMSEMSRNNYYTSYTNWKQTARKAAEMETADAEADIEKLRDETKEKLFDSMPDNAYTAGLKSFQSFIDGWNSGMGGHGIALPIITGTTSVVSGTANTALAPQNIGSGGQSQADTEKAAEIYADKMAERINKLGIFSSSVSSAGGALGAWGAVMNTPLVINIDGVGKIETTFGKLFRDKRISDSLN